MSIYRQSTLGTASNQITFNLLGQYPYYRMTSVTLTRRELVEFDIKLPEGMGDTDYQSLEGKAYLLISGTMYPQDEASYDRGRRALRKAASLAIEQADTAADQGYVPYIWAEADGISKMMSVKVMYVDIPQSTRNGLKQPFRLLCKVKYPVILGAVATTANIGLGTATTTSGIGYPFAFPVAYGSNSYTSTGAITNAGDIPGFPSSIIIYGPVNVTRLTNTRTGEYIELNVNLPTSGDTAIISYDQDSFSMTQGGNTIASRLTSGSTLFKLSPGITNFTLTGTSIGNGSYATINMQSAWPLS